MFALVGALGANLELLSDTLSELVEECGYHAQLIRLSELLHQFERWKDLPAAPVDDHIDKHQKAGNAFRRALKDGGALASLAVSAIRNHREEQRGAGGGDDPRDLPVWNSAYIIRSLKNPEEIKRLRQVYGSTVLVLAGFAPRSSRVDRLSQQIAESRSSFTPQDFAPKADTLINVDEAEIGNKLGQNVRDTFPLADAFFDLTDSQRLRTDLTRFVEIVFDHPFHTPTQDEYVMFHAKAAALRSSDFSRQVGAAIATDDGQVIAVGCNEVPKAGGGAYWENDNPDYRDFAMNRDASTEMKLNAVTEILDKLQSAKWLSDTVKKLPPDLLGKKAAELLRATRTMNVGEFGRTVHAEMSALLEASRRGVSTQDQNLYVTTFPCHNCARHIISSGIKRVVYIEPYPKSLAKVLHMDSILVDVHLSESGKIVFEPFIGVSPTRYFDFFVLTERTDSQGKPRRWRRPNCLPRLPEKDAHLSYIPQEQVRVLALSKGLKTAKLKVVRSGR